MRALWIRSDTKTVEEVFYEGLDDLQRMVGGGIVLAHAFENKDVVYVDANGMLKCPKDFFILRGGYQPLSGNGVLVGRERRNSAQTFDPRTPRETLTGLIRFCTVADLMHAHGHA